VKLVALVAAGVAATAALAAAPAGATNECRGLQVCVSLAGPWVVVPAGSALPRPRVEYQLSCPKGYVVGGLDAELTDAGIEVSFQALLGSPVNPGITTSRAAVFVATAVGRPSPASSFRPHIGCVPSAGGGRRIPTVAHVVPPGHPSVRRVWTVRVRAGAHRLAKACASGETLVAASHAVGFYTGRPPSAALVSSVHASQVVRAGRVNVAVQAGPAVSGVRAVVQVDLTCAGGA
jgi:hypothetical protein